MKIKRAIKIEVFKDLKNLKILFRRGESLS